ncbi:hypothetical protein GGI12_000861 [Dipsacomyces acuminosporus]|nr:hypothetical protein GGI12_000861 [Dipsacomyces acuminosporus]
MGYERPKSHYGVSLIHAKATRPTRCPGSSKALADVIQEECPSLAEGAAFKPSLLAPGPHGQTIYAFLGYYAYYAHSWLFPRFTRELFTLADGGTVALDWALCKNHAERPIVAVISGVTGTSCDYYVRKCYEKFVELEYSVVVIHSRGCGGAVLTTPLPFHAGLTDDCREVIQAIHRRLPRCKLLGLSFSLGGNIMAKYIGEEAGNCLLTAAVVVGNPYDMYRVIKHLDSGFITLNKIYDFAILNFLKTAFKANEEVIRSAPVDFDVGRIVRSMSIMGFTEEMTRKAFGYPSAKELLDDSSSEPYMDSIEIPVLFLNSRDDPICIEGLVPFEKFLSNPNLVLALTEHGGHIGYVSSSGIWPSSWVEHPVSEFFQCYTTAALRASHMVYTTLLPRSWFKVRLYHADEERQVKKGGKAFIQQLRDKCPSIADPAHAHYTPPWMLFYEFEREVFSFDDGGIAAVDWALPRLDTTPASPIVVLIPGVAGLSSDYYARSLIHCISQKPFGYQVVVLHSRGCNGVDMTTQIGFHGGATDDLRTFMVDLRQRYPEAPFLAAGFSLGANLLTKYIGEEGDKCPFIAATSLCNPFDIHTTVEKMCTPTLKNRFLYGSSLTNSLLSLYRKNKKVILAGEVELDDREIEASRNVIEFNEAYTKKVFGYKSAKELHDSASCVSYLKDVKVPMLFINAADDPMCVSSTIPYAEFEANPHLILACTRYGGHIAFFQGTGLKPWLPQQISLFIQAMLEWS